MQIVATILVILHFLGLASLLGSFLVQTKDIGAGKGRVLIGMVHGALTQLVTGLALVAIYQLADLHEVNNMKIGVKLLVALAITVLVFMFRKVNPAPSWALWAIGGLTVANVVVAVAWK
ncbi:MAG TPA: hypothetical protein VFU07_02600 [Candidatus Lumbricidophila sp.]|nr:hypothetical protein [Candidatus Lumbricidophila sp.]